MSEEVRYSWVRGSCMTTMRIDSVPPEWEGFGWFIGRLLRDWHWTELPQRIELPGMVVESREVPADYPRRDSFAMRVSRLVWCNTLAVSDIGDDEHFRDLGADSMAFAEAAVQLAAAASANHGVPVELVAVQSDTLRLLADNLTAAGYFAE